MSVSVDATAVSEARAIGSGSRILAFARVGPHVDIGSDCIVGSQAALEGEVTLADGVEVQAGARLLGPLSVGPRSAIGMNAVLAGSDPTVGAAEIVLGPNVLIGANVAVLPGVSMGRGAVVRPGSVVTENVPANAVVSGNPARIVAYVDSGHEAPVREVVMPTADARITETGVNGVTIHGLTNARDLRGALTAAEFATLPFPPQRLFTVYDVPSESVRGSHAHRECAQFLICVAGVVSCLVDDGSTREEIRLASSEVGLHIPPMIWGTQWKYTREAVLLVLASHAYEAEDYIRDYEEFLQALDGR
jgi:UDP-2-acetamido-3-amino-2,3-dideoxy-glucuronate N-acetyltransferase